jgi:hypothetical protein
MANFNSFLLFFVFSLPQVMKTRQQLQGKGFGSSEAEIFGNIQLM